MIIKNQSGQVVTGKLINVTNGADYVGTVTCSLSIDGGAVVTGSVNSGLCTSDGSGLYSYTPTAAETNGNFIAYNFEGSGAIPYMLPVAPLTPAQTAAITSVTGPGVRSVLDIITAAYQRLGILQAGQTLSGDDAQLGLQRFNDLVDSLSTQRLQIFQVLNTTFPIVANQSTYPIGLGGTINIARPLYIDHVNFIDTSQPSPNGPLERPCFGPITEDAYAAIPIKTLPGIYPRLVYYQKTFPLASLIFWPVPTSTTLQGVVYTPTAVSSFSSLTAAVALPPGYNRMLRDMLAVELMPDFTDIAPNPSLLQAASDAMANVKRINAPELDLATDMALITHMPFYNILLGP